MAAAACALLLSVPASAQYHRRGHVRADIVVGPGPWGPWGPWGSFWPPYYPPYPPYPPYAFYGRVDDTAHLKTEIEPKQARIYVDGYYAGIADDFDGLFQSLAVAPGPHDITAYLEGYRTTTRQMYFGPDAGLKLRLRLEPLRQGETSEAPPQPHRTAPLTPGVPTAAPPPPPLPPSQEPPAPPASSPETAAPPSEAAGFGAVSISVQPADAEISIDGQPWTGSAAEQPLVVQLAEGPHTIAISKAGYRPFSIHVEVTSGETTPINVRLPRM
jgi:hypothetical protein